MKKTMLNKLATANRDNKIKYQSFLSKQAIARVAFDRAKVNKARLYELGLTHKDSIDWTDLENRNNATDCLTTDMHDISAKVQRIGEYDDLHDVISQTTATHNRRSYGSRFTFVPLDHQHDLFNAMMDKDNPTTKYDVLIECALHKRLILKWALKHNVALYYDWINTTGDKPYDLDDCMSDCTISLFENVNGWNIGVNDYGLCLVWNDDATRKAFYTAITSNVYRNSASKGRKGKYKVGYIATTPENEFMYFDKLSDIYSLFGDDIITEICSLHRNFCDMLTDIEMDIFIALLEVGHNFNGVAKLTGLTRYRVEKMYTVIRDKYKVYEDCYDSCYKAVADKKKAANHKAPVDHRYDGIKECFRNAL